MPEIIIAEYHDQVYTFWDQQGMRDLKVAHVDFHCDMRGVLIDRKRGSVFSTSRREASSIDPGNYLGHAIMNGIVTDLQWIHCEKSGRHFDEGPVLHYATDLLAPWYRLKKRVSRKAEIPLTYRESSLSDWQGPRSGEQLDLDWDALASVEFDENYRKTAISNFLAKEFPNIPEITFLVYSPTYSDPDRSMFDEFAERLAGRFKAGIHRLPTVPPEAAAQDAGTVRGMIRNVIPPQVRRLRTRLAEQIRLHDSVNDLGYYSDH